MSRLMRIALIVFVVGVAMNYLGGERFRVVAFVVQVAAAIMLLVNAARSHRRAAEGHERDGLDDRG